MLEVERIENYCLVGIEFQLYKMESATKMDGGDVCTTLWMHLASLNCVPKMIKMANFMFCAFYHNT